MTNPEAPLPTEYLATDHGSRIAYVRTPGKGPELLFCGGFASDMTGTKATTLEAHARARGYAFTRFDYSGHGQSSGSFAEGTIGLWKRDALAVLDQITDGPVIIIGSSMGGWMALMLAKERPERCAALIGLAPAPDFTEDLMWAGFCQEIRDTLERDRIYRQPSDYSDEPYTITMDLIEDGRNHLVLREPLPLSMPIRLLHGMRDTDVPVSVSHRIVEHVSSEDVRLTLIKAGDHRLSTDADLALLLANVDELVATVGSESQSDERQS